jgi:hypothetical protein
LLKREEDFAIFFESNHIIDHLILSETSKELKRTKSAHIVAASFKLHVSADSFDDVISHFDFFNK